MASKIGFYALSCCDFHFAKVPDHGVVAEGGFPDVFFLEDLTRIKEVHI